MKVPKTSSPYRVERWELCEQFILYSLETVHPMFIMPKLLCQGQSLLLIPQIQLLSLLLAYESKGLFWFIMESSFLRDHLFHQHQYTTALLQDLAMSHREKSLCSTYTTASFLLYLWGLWAFYWTGSWWRPIEYLLQLSSWCPKTIYRFSVLSDSAYLLDLKCRYVVAIAPLIFCRDPTTHFSKILTSWFCRSLDLSPKI